MSLFNTVANQVARLQKKQDNNNAAYHADVCAVAVEEARKLRGEKVKPRFTDDEKALILSTWEGDHQEFAALVALAVKRMEWAEEAAKGAELKEAARQAEQAFREADEREGQRRREALKDLERLQQEVQSAITNRDKATEAKSNLYGTAGFPSGYKENAEQGQKLATKIKKLEAAIDDRFPRELDSGLLPNIQEHPGALQAVATRELNKLGHNGVADTPESRKRWTDIQQAARLRVDSLRKEVAKLKSEYAKLNKESERLSELRLQPEQIPTRLRVGPTLAAQLGIKGHSRDDRMKANAKKLELVPSE